LSLSLQAAIAVSPPGPDDFDHECRQDRLTVEDELTVTSSPVVISAAVYKVVGSRGEPCLRGGPRPDRRRQPRRPDDSAAPALARDRGSRRRAASRDGDPPAR